MTYYIWDQTIYDILSLRRQGLGSMLTLWTFVRDLATFVQHAALPNYAEYLITTTFQHSKPI